MATDTVPITEHGVATLSEQAWERARRRAEIIGPLAQSKTIGHEAADAAAQALGLSRRQVYVLIRRARQGSGLVTDLALGQSSGGKGKAAFSGFAHKARSKAKTLRFWTATNFRETPVMAPLRLSPAIDSNRRLKIAHSFKDAHPEAVKRWS